MVRNLFKVLPPRSMIVGIALIALLVAVPRAAVADDSLETKEVIENLMLCYGEGTDAIGDSTRNDPLQDGKDIYADCFTDDAVFSVWFPGTPFDGPPTIPPAIGPEAWADFVFLTFDGTYAFTQHILTNMMVTIDGSNAELTAYLNASHVAHDEEGAVSRVDIANGTYTLQVEKIMGEWKVTNLDLTLITFNPFFEAPKPKGGGK